MKGDSMRGLAVFISDIRNCKSRELEIKRINKELANIRSKFKGDKPLDGYQKKKYVCKLLFIFLLGHDIDFGHEMAVNLLQSIKYTEKQIGYLFISVLVGASSDLLKMIVLAVRNDLLSRNPIFVNLALQCIANIGSREMAEAFNADVSKLLVSSDTIDMVKQSAALCLLGMVRSAPDAVQFGEWSSRVVHLLNDQHLGVVTSSVSLIDALARRTPDEYRGCVALAISRLNRIISSTYTDLQDYTYYFVACPWLCVKLLRLLQNYPPPEDPTHRSKLNECLENVLAKAQEAPKSKKVQHSNAKNAVLFEAINLIIHLDCDAALLVKACQQLGQFLAHRETNLRYLALESMCLLATSEFSHEAVKKHQETVIGALKTEKDVSVRQRAVDLLYAMCDKSNAENIVGEMLGYLESADYAIREEMVLKIAILAEKYATDYTWYVDTILNLIRIAGDYVSEEVWYRVIQIVINRDDVQAYAASMCFEALRAPACHENMVKVGGYILGEFGNLIAGEPKSNAHAQFSVLHEKFALCSLATRGLLLTTYLKFVNLFPELKATVLDALRNDSNIRSSDVEIQQRAVEYARLAEFAVPEVLATVLEEMPPFPERESSILAKLKKKNAAAGVATVTTVPSAMPQPKMSAQAAASASNGVAAVEKKLEIAAAVSNVEEDLLGLNVSINAAPSAPAQVSPRGDTLADVFETAAPAIAPVAEPVPSELTPGSEAGFSKLVLKNSGVLFENDVIQIGWKSEYRQNLVRIAIFYGNKTQLPFSQFTVRLVRSGSAEQQAAITVTVKELDRPVVDQGAQMQQQINVECVTDFEDAGVLQVRFLHAGLPHSLNFRLPVTPNKFLEITDMDANAFFARWKQLAGPAHESQRIFKAKFNINDGAALAQKWIAFGLANLVNIDPNSENLVGAGIVHSTRGQIGVLARLEPNKQTGMYRLTVRSTRQLIAARFTELLEPHL